MHGTLTAIGTDDVAYQGQGEMVAVVEEGFDLGNAEDVYTAFHAIRTLLMMRLMIT